MSVEQQVDQACYSQSLSESLLTSGSVREFLYLRAPYSAMAAAMRISYKKPAGSEQMRLSGLTGGYIESGSGVPPVTKPKEIEITPEMRYVAQGLGVKDQILKDIQYRPDSSNHVYSGNLAGI